mmetsp:Transcript_1401/g.4170  ORF Transcript_1401/g.4170 Transcript_1401/m.4170 type:complete len:81 (-) Transcript_1401:683-925(-)
MHLTVESSGIAQELLCGLENCHVLCNFLTLSVMVLSSGSRALLTRKQLACGDSLSLPEERSANILRIYVSAREPGDPSPA